MIRTAIFKHLVVGTWQQGTLLIMRRNIIYFAILEHSVCISQGSLKKENQWDICVYIKRFFFQGIGSAIVGAGKFEIHTAGRSKIFKVGQQAGNSARS